MIRLHVEDDLSEGRQLVLPEAQGRYLVQVMRRGPGDEILLFNGRDGEWLARLASVNRREVRIEAMQRTRPQPPRQGPVLVLALVKRAALETAVAKAVELGVAEIRLALTDRTNADHTRLDRLQAIAAEAAEQTGRLDLPRLKPPQPLNRVLDGLAAEGPVIFCDEAGEARPLLEVLDALSADRIGVVIGPEGGFTPAERAHLRSHPGVTPASLGPRILRADTAALSALTLVQARLGDWRG